MVCSILFSLEAVIKYKYWTCSCCSEPNNSFLNFDETAQ